MDYKRLFWATGQAILIVLFAVVVTIIVTAGVYFLSGPGALVLVLVLMVAALTWANYN